MSNSSVIAFAAALSFIALAVSGCGNKESASVTTPGGPVGKSGPPPTTYSASGKRMQPPPPGMRVAPPPGSGPVK